MSIPTPLRENPWAETPERRIFAAASPIRPSIGMLKTPFGPRQDHRSVLITYLAYLFYGKTVFFLFFVFEKTIIYKIHSLYSILLLPLTTFSCYYYYNHIIITRDEADWQIRILHWTCIRLFTAWFVSYCLLECNKKELESAAQQDIVIEITD